MLYLILLVVLPIITSIVSFATIFSAVFRSGGQSPYELFGIWYYVLTIGLGMAYAALYVVVMISMKSSVERYFREIVPIGLAMSSAMIPLVIVAAVISQIPLVNLIAVLASPITIGQCFLQYELDRITTWKRTGVLS